MDMPMTDMKAIADLMKHLEDQLIVCMRCGMCQAVCPVFAETGREADVARGKLALLDGLLQEMFADPTGVSERLNRCLLCGSCAANCPSGVDVLDIFLKARAILTGVMGLSPAKRLVLRGMLSHPELFDRIAEWGSRFQHLFVKPVNTIVGTSCARFTSPLLADRHVMPLAEVPFHRRLPSRDSAPGPSGVTAAVFTGCLIDKIYPRIAEATLSALDHHGVGVFLPEGQACCGIPALSSGDTETFRRLVQHNVALFEHRPFDALVTACATCTSTIGKVWPAMSDLLPAPLRGKVVALSKKAMDISAFLVHRTGLSALHHPAEQPDRVTYHDPCHLKKSLGVFNEPRALIAANPSYVLTEMLQPDACCGMGGSFNLQYYAISSKIGTLKRDQIAATGSTVVSTGCPACMLQISDMLSRHNDRIAIRHPVEIYAEGVAAARRARPAGADRATE
jgi:glycolate oxidase iron-sulfur subunit